MQRLAPLLLVLAAILAAPVQAQVQLSPEEQREIERDWLFNALRTAPSEKIGHAVADQIWRFWMAGAPDREAAELMQAAMERRQAYDFAGAMEHLDRLVAHAPKWSEAWNQRATVLFFQENYDESLEDVERVLELEPRHFGALAGKGVILMRQGRVELAQKALREAVEIHPWLAERHMLLQVPGKDL